MDGPEMRLADLASSGLLRHLRPLESAAGAKVVLEGRELHNFASNDYLGLASHPELLDAMVEGLGRYGVGSASSRLVCGTLPPHQRFEEELAAAKGTEASLSFSSGYATALGTIPVIVGKGDFVVLDKLSHACLVDASRLSGATMRIFPHNDPAKLRRLLSSIRAKHARARILVVTESVFSMDGDVCPLRELVGIAREHDALVFLDEAHGFGLLGASGMGLAEKTGLGAEVTFQMGTLSKAAGLAGGTLCASRTWIDLLVNRARSFVYSTAPPPAVVHAASASLRLIRSEEGSSRRARLWRYMDDLGAVDSPIFPVILGGNEAALAAAQVLIRAGYLVPAIRYPTVPRGKARLRISLSAGHDRDVVQALAETLAGLPRMPADDSGR